ncbi:MAG: porin family protein [Bacteroidota bacterium]
MHRIKATYIFFTVFILVVMPFAAFGQINISTGVTGGLNYAIFGGSDVSNVSTITQYAAGVFAEIRFPLLPILIQPEILYCVKGSEQTIPSMWAFGSPSINTYKNSYIEIPILVKYYFPTPTIKPFIFLGPSVGFLVNAKETIAYVNEPQYNHEIDVKDLFKSTDVGAVVGVGAKIPLTVVDLTLDARYNYGFIPLYKNDSPYIYNRVISVCLGVTF